MARILFVDDDPYTLETLTKSVQLFGHEALHATSGKEALAQAITHSPDLIMTDMMLPDMDGLNLLNQLHLDAATAEIPIIMLSASPEVDLAELCKAAGAEMFLNKPVRLQTLLDIIQRYASG